MALSPKEGIWAKLVWPWKPESEREAGSAVVSNFLLHWFPSRVTLRSLAFCYSFYLGTISFTLFMILVLTGVVLMFHYVPSVERAYWSIKDIDFAVSFGWFLRRVHRLAAHLMVAVVFLHLVRVFLTAAYKRGTAVGSNREVNWILGVLLLVLTLLLSFTGYLLPWDQLAYWAITVGTSIAASVPVLGNQIRYFLVGGSEIGQNTLIRFYVLHVALLPLVLFAIAAWHMWRVRKDGGLAITEQVRAEARGREPKLPSRTKTYSVLGIASGTSVHVFDPTTTSQEDSVPSSPHLTTRLLLVVVATCAVTALLALVFAAPLEEAANPKVTPNPAKAPWYFLGLQELVSYSALIGGVVLPGVLLAGLAAIPLIDRRQEGIGLWIGGCQERRWAVIGGITGIISTVGSLTLGIRVPMRSLFSSIESQLFFDLVNPATLLLLLFGILYLIALRRTASTRCAVVAAFFALSVSFLLLTYTGTVLRGPNWAFFWPWQVWPQHPIPF